MLCLNIILDLFMFVRISYHVISATEKDIHIQVASAMEVPLPRWMVIQIENPTEIWMMTFLGTPSLGNLYIYSYDWTRSGGKYHRSHSATQPL